MQGWKSELLIYVTFVHFAQNKEALNITVFTSAQTNRTSVGSAHSFTTSAPNDAAVNTP